MTNAKELMDQYRTANGNEYTIRASEEQIQSILDNGWSAVPVGAYLGQTNSEKDIIKTSAHEATVGGRVITIPAEKEESTTIRYAWEIIRLGLKK